MSSASYDVVVIGAGIVGAACADQLSRDGLRVAVVERDLVGGGATAAGMGHIVAMDDSPAQFALTRYSQQLWRVLRSELPAEVEYQECGTLWIAADEAEMAEVVRKHNFYIEAGLPATVIGSRKLERLEPNLRPGMSGALLVPEDAVIYPPCAARFLLERAQRRGAETFLGNSVSQIEDGAVQLGNGTRLRTQQTVLATGAWASELIPELAVQRRKGHLVITDRYPGFVRHQLIELGYLKSAHSLTADSVAFNVQPRATGQMLIGSSRQYGAEDKQVEDAILHRMLQRAFTYLPGLREVSAIRTWTGFRAATPDKLPLLGPIPGRQGLLLATGHEGLGITTSLGTAALIADHVTGRTPAIPLEPYLPTRSVPEAAFV